MKTCPRCGAQLEDYVSFCPDCGNAFVETAPMYDPYDHTAEFDPKDISDNKVYGMLIYLTSLLGIIVALLASKDSPYVHFHVRQCLKLTVCEILLALISGVLFWTIVIPFLAGLATLVLLVIQIICFVRVCKGQAKEAPIVCKLGFMN